MQNHSQDDLKHPPADKRWALNSAAFNSFLSLLGDDQDKAAEKYEEVRRKLIAFFEARRCQFPEEYADQTIDRVCRKIADGEMIQHIEAYCLGVARYVFLEASRKTRRSEIVDIDFYSSPDTYDSAYDKTHFDCLEQCLEKLSPDQRELILTYYEKDKREKIDERKRLARLLCTSASTLRIRIYRIKESLTACLEDCLEPGVGV